MKWIVKIDMYTAQKGGIVYYGPFYSEDEATSFRGKYGGTVLELREPGAW